MFLVIFGAGASYDSVPSRPPSRYARPSLFTRPPLADELFLADNFFADCLSLYPRAKPIVPYLQQPQEQGASLEHVLEELQAEGDSDPERKRQVAAIRFYLHHVLWQCERRWNGTARGTTNYLTLLDQLRRSREARSNDKPILLVTFNYDTLIEQSLASFNMPLNEVDDYIRGDFFKLFKVHGSINWVREIDSTILNVQEKNHSDLVHEFIDKVPELQVSDRFRCVTRSLDDPVGKIDSKPVFPAIAIPVETKVSFECPSDHLDALSRHLPEVTHVLTIGWRGNEAHFLKLLEAGFNGRSVLFQTVANGKPDAEAVLARIKGAGINASGEATPYGGFTDYVVRREAEKFFRS
jgi:hypothetical protein